MSRGALIPARLRAGWRTAMRRLDAMPERERLALLAGALALVVAAEWTLVLPARALRQTMLAAGAEQVQAESDAVAEAANAQAQRAADLETLVAQLDRDLVRLGVGKSSGEPLSFLLERALARNAARVVGLRELGVEDVDTSGASAAAPPDGPASSGATLYRHRFELTLAGDVPALTAAVRTLDQQARPLRIERVRLSSADGAAVEAAITLSVVGTQRSWLSL